MVRDKQKGFRVGVLLLFIGSCLQIIMAVSMLFLPIIPFLGGDIECSQPPCQPPQPRSLFQLSFPSLADPIFLIVLVLLVAAVLPGILAMIAYRNKKFGSMSFRCGLGGVISLIVAWILLCDAGGFYLIPGALLMLFATPILAARIKDIEHN